METLALRQTHELTTTLADELQTRLLEPARRSGVELQVLGVTPVPTESVVLRGSDGGWMLTSYEDDPTAARHGGIPVPAVQRERLQALERAGVAPDLVWLAHELPAEWTDGSEVPVPAPPNAGELDRRIDSAVTRSLAAGAAGASALATLVNRARTRLVPAPKPALAPPAPAPTLDPVVLGGVVDRETGLVAWVVLAQWDW